MARYMGLTAWYWDWMAILLELDRRYEEEGMVNPTTVGNRFCTATKVRDQQGRISWRPTAP